MPMPPSPLALPEPALGVGNGEAEEEEVAEGRLEDSPSMQEGVGDRVPRAVSVARGAVAEAVAEAQGEEEEECVGERVGRGEAVALAEGVAVLPSAAP